MIKFKTIRNISFIGLILFSSISCNQEDYLETQDKTRLTEAQMWETESTADLYLNTCYNELVAKGNQPDNLDSYTDDNDAGYYYTSFNWKKGIVNKNTNTENVWGQQSGPTNDASWEGTYRKVRKCNTFMEKITENKANYTEAWYNKRMDEARFLRAFFYSELFYRLGGLSIVTKPQDRKTDSEAEMYIARSSFEETFNFITSELGDIVENAYLPVKYGKSDANCGRATLGAALALKGYVELFAASPAYNSADPAVPRTADNLWSFATPDPARWATAAATNKQFIDTWGPAGTGTYGLFSPMSQFWHEANEYNSEVIWDRQHVASTMANTFDTYGGPVWIFGTYYTWGNYCPTQELVDQYQMANGLNITDPASGYDPQNPYVGREKRFYDFIVYDGATYQQDWMPGPDVIYTRIDKVHPSKNQIDFGSDDVGNTGYYFKKRLDNAHPRGGNQDGRNYVYYRYSEVLLNYAEAQNEALAAPDQSVYDAINAIRTRPGTDLPPVAAGLTKDQMREVIRHERRVELVLENKRLFDIWRWKIAMDVMNVKPHCMVIRNSSPDDNSGVWVYNVEEITGRFSVFTQKMYFNPIPQAIIDRNPKIKQNWGYE